MNQADTKTVSKIVNQELSTYAGIDIENRSTVPMDDTKAFVVVTEKLRKHVTVWTPEGKCILSVGSLNYLFHALKVLHDNMGARGYKQG